MEKRVKGVLPMDRSEQRVSPSLSENLIYFRNSFAESSDFLAREFQLNGTDGCVFSMDHAERMHLHSGNGTCVMGF